MSFTGGDYLLLLREVANNDIDNGDFVTVSRIEYSDIIYEHLITFSDIEIKRRISPDAYHAKTKESAKNIRQGHEKDSG